MSEMKVMGVAQWSPMRAACALLGLGAVLATGGGLAPAQAAGQAVSADAATYRGWVQEMKAAERGPFTRLRWYCKDGSVHPPKPYPCDTRGGSGVQHGEWSERTQKLRAQGYFVATLLAGVDAKAAQQMVAAPDFTDRYAQLVVEKYLIATDDGWVLRRAQFYRGAVQEEDEREGARALLTAMAGRPEWIGYRYAALRAGAQALPHGHDTASVLGMRQLAASIADRDPGFASLRVKIHGSPEAGDAARVRTYAKTSKKPELKAEYEKLAGEIEQVFRAPPLAERVAADAKALKGDAAVACWLQQAAADLAQADAATRFARTAQLLAQIRDGLPQVKSAADRLRLIDLSLAAESEHFRAGAELREGTTRATRRTNLAVLQTAVGAAYGSGLLNTRERAELAKGFESLAPDVQEVGRYGAVLRDLGRVPGWGTQTLRMYFGPAMAKLGELEPKAELFIQDQLRGSPLLFYGNVLDGLTRDANRLAGVQHKLFGQDIGVGVNALNPGLARGMLVAQPDMAHPGRLREDGIVVLPETVSDLPPVAGILTSGAGNPLSHVQLLARNLGIPNVAIDESLLATLKRHNGERVVLAVSAAGLVELAADGPRWEAVFGKGQAATDDVVFEPDLKKLDLSVRDFISLDKLRADDSGRIVGPKAAKLGELKARFPKDVVPGVAIPFGLYRQAVLDKPYGNTGKSFYDWMVGQFRALEALPAGAPATAQASEKLRAEIYRHVRTTDPGPAFREHLKAAMAREFGADFKGGVFVRSDTNVEDLPGFTGAGLNLTLPNVVGFEKLMDGLSEVWASPYTARAWAWRQSHMRGPEHVYPAVLLLRTVPAEKSGVMITQDVDSGDRNVLSVAVNEGVGGAVEGQAAESVRVDVRTAAVKLMATATAPTRMVPQATGGVALLPTSGADTLLQPGEIRQLVEFSQQIPKQFPQHDESGGLAAADVEFAFVGGKLWLLQIRPFNESKRARGSEVLIGMDRALAGQQTRKVNLQEAAQ